MTSRHGSFHCRFLISFLGVTFLLLATFVVSGWASGSGEHHHDSDMTDHMQEMQSVKVDIPEEYQIMTRTPIVADTESLRLGGELFTQNCSVCHGEKGDGKGPAAKSLQTPPANFLDIKHSSIYGPGEKYWIIAHGTETTGMPEFSQLTPVERWHLVNYIYQLQQKKPVEQKTHGHD